MLLIIIGMLTTCHVAVVILLTPAVTGNQNPDQGHMVQHNMGKRMRQAFCKGLMNPGPLQAVQNDNCILGVETSRDSTDPAPY